ncbi:MAG: hypothetical protein ACO3JL_05820 [Myxococcota bacterium]
MTLFRTHSAFVGAATSLLLSSCGPRVLEGLSCDEIGLESCEGTALYVCNGSEFQKTADCHHQCVVRPPTEHDEETLTASETWTCAEGPHLVTRVLTLGPGVELRVEPGAEVRFGPGARIDTSPNSRLWAEGTREQPLLFTSNNETVGGWGSLNQGGLNLYVRGTDEEPSVVTHTVVERAVNGIGVLSVEEGMPLPRIENTQLRDHLSFGILLRGCVGEPALPTFEDDGNTFVNNGEGAISGCQ